MRYLVLLLLLIPTSVSAHQLSSDNTIGAVLHVDPSDDPIIGQAATFYWDIEDTSGRFSLDECDCMVHISRAGKELIATPVTEGSGTTAAFTYTFPERGAYTIELMGTPTSAQTFDEFSLTYSLRVSRMEEGTGIPDWVWALPAGAAILLLALFARKVPREKRRSSQHNKS